MTDSPHSRHHDDVEQLLRNAELRDELEPYYDESISRVNVQHLPLNVENEYLASMLAWETAPILPIYKWFDPEMRPPRPAVLSDRDLHEILWDVVRRLYEQRIVLDFTDHLSDRELYCLIYRDIPAREKKIDSSAYLRWDCPGPVAIRRSGCGTLRQRGATALGHHHQPLPPRSGRRIHAPPRTAVNQGKADGDREETSRRRERVCFLGRGGVRGRVS